MWKVIEEKLAICHVLFILSGNYKALQIKNSITKKGGGGLFKIGASKIIIIINQYGNEVEIEI